MKKLVVILTAAILMAMSTPVFAQEGGQTPILIDETSTQINQEPILKDVQTISEDGQRVIIKIYEAPPNYDFTLLGNTGFQKNGYHYRQGDIIQLSENYDKQIKLASQVMTVSHEEKNGIGQFVPLMDYNTDGFTGQLKLDTQHISWRGTDRIQQHLRIQINVTYMAFHFKPKGLILGLVAEP